MTTCAVPSNVEWRPKENQELLSYWRQLSHSNSCIVKHSVGRLDGFISQENIYFSIRVLGNGIVIWTRWLTISFTISFCLCYCLE